jgi:hypothetical protein
MKIKKTKTIIYQLYYYPTTENISLDFRPTRKEIMDIASDKAWDIEALDIYKLDIYGRKS